jgi:hypothetical protein
MALALYEAVPIFVLQSVENVIIFLLFIYKAK